jgi:hypothetical protein
MLPLRPTLEYKSQHFVPQCYLRSFSINNDRRSIALYNYANQRSIFGASIKGQCAKDYFYDETGSIDKIFNGYEGKYAEIVRSIVESGTTTEEGFRFLRCYAYLQHLRTEAMAKIQEAMMSEMVEFIFKDDPEGQEWAKFDPRTIPRESISNFILTMPYFAGLTDCLVINKTGNPFITSDNPSVIANRFHVQRRGQRHGGSGIISSGFMMILPISPKILFVSYDKGVYGANLNRDGVIFAHRDKDIEALNALQILKASQNLYFHNVNNSKYVEMMVSKYKVHRPAAWNKWIFAVECEATGSETHKFYRVVKTPEEMRTGDGFFHNQSLAVNPKTWCSLFAIREKPRYFDTKSMVGLVRSEELMNLRRFLREPSFPVKVPRKSQS